MKSFMLSRGARLTCALTTAFFALAIWCTAPSFAASGGGANSYERGHLHLKGSTLGHTSSGSFTGTLVRTIVALLVVIAVIYGLSWILKQGRASKNPSVGDGLTQIASLPLGPNRSVTLIRVGAELHLLGVAEHGINGIRVFSEEEAYELGIPFDTDEFDSPGQGGTAVAQRLVDALRRLTVR